MQRLNLTKCVQNERGLEEAAEGGKCFLLHVLTAAVVVRGRDKRSIHLFPNITQCSDFINKKRKRGEVWHGGTCVITN